VCAATLTPAVAQSRPQAVSDDHQQFTITLPADWTPSPLDPTVLTREVPAAARPLITTGATGLIAFGPGGASKSAPMVFVTAIPLTQSGSVVDPLQLVDALRAAPGAPPGLRILQEGGATVAGLPAYYVYATADAPARPGSLYTIMVFMAVGQTGYYAYGATVNNPDRVRTDFATISAIFETFRPAAPPQVQRLPQPAPETPASAGNPNAGVFMVFAVPRAPERSYDVAGGTAFFISPDGTALTDSHVVYEAYVNPAYELVALVNGEFYGADVVCASVLTHNPWDNPSAAVAPSRDVAEIRLTSPPVFPFDSLHPPGVSTYGYAHQGPLPSFPALRLGSDPVVGEPVHFVGYGGSAGAVPYALTTAGTVRKVDTASDGTPIFTISLQGTAVHGDSGSPVLDERGEVVGLLAWASSPDLHLGFAMTRAALDPVCR
jgi:S1-C subfamily serine protease